MALAQQNLERIQAYMQNNGHSSKLHNSEVHAIADIFNALWIQEAFHKEKSGNKWLELGNRYSHFFHVPGINATRNNIYSMLIND